MDHNDDAGSQREAHYNTQQRSSLRSSLRSDKSLNPPRSRPQSGQQLGDFVLPVHTDRADSETLPQIASAPAPDVPHTRSRANSAKRIGRSRVHRQSQNSPGDDKRSEETFARLHPHDHVTFDPDPPRTPTGERNRHPNREFDSNRFSTPTPVQRSFPPGRLTPLGISRSQLDITALPAMSDASEKTGPMGDYYRSKKTPSAQRASTIATELYTISYLILFAIWGTLARLGLQALTFYPGAPVIFSELWANVAGTFIMGFLSQDRQLFRDEWGQRGEKIPEPEDRPARSDNAGRLELERQESNARHGKVKKTIPMYIGLATGFCGSFTSFSSFIRDVFLSLSNDLKSPNNPSTMRRHNGDSVMAVLATVIITISTCYAALKVGAHFAILTSRFTPSLSFNIVRRFIDPFIVFISFGTWLGAILMTIFPPHNAWRSQALFALVFAPLGCLLRYYLSLRLNPLVPWFPLGTFTVNIFGTAVLGMAYDLQHVPLDFSGLPGGSLVGCQVLQGIEDGFCGCLTTVSTWMAEIDTLKRRHAYGYAGASVVGGVGLLVVVVGSVRWGVDWQSVLCKT